VKLRQFLATQAAEPNYIRDCAIFWLYYRQGLTAKAIAQLPDIGLTVKGVEKYIVPSDPASKGHLNQKALAQNGFWRIKDKCLVLTRSPSLAVAAWQ